MRQVILFESDLPFYQNFLLHKKATDFPCKVLPPLTGKSVDFYYFYKVKLLCSTLSD